MFKKFCFILFVFCFFSFGLIACSNNDNSKNELSSDYKLVKDLEGFRFKVPKNDYKNFKDLSEITTSNTSDLKYITTDKNKFFIQSDSDNYFVIVNINSLKDTKDLKKIEEELNKTQTFQLSINENLTKLEQINKATLKQPNINQTYFGYFSVLEDKNENNAWMFVGFTDEKEIEQAKYMIDSFKTTNKRNKDSSRNISNNEEIQIIGNEDVGFLKIPKEFTKKSESPLQYIDTSANNLFTMNKITGSSPEVISKDLTSVFTENKVKEIKEEVSYIGYRKTLTLSGTVDGQNFIIWLFSDDLDKNTTYYLSLTYTVENNLQNYIQTWSLNK